VSRLRQPFPSPSILVHPLIIPPFDALCSS
jgi:hypothetical protein